MQTMYCNTQRCFNCLPPILSSRYGDHCQPPYMDCSETWKPFTLGSMAFKYFDHVKHSKLCTELLLEAVCHDLSATAASGACSENRQGVWISPPMQVPDALDFFSPRTVLDEGDF